MQELLHNLWDLIKNGYAIFSYFIAGLIGAIITVWYLRDRMNTRTDYIVFVLSGAFTAHYLTDFIVKICSKIGWHFEAGQVGGIGFLLGAFGGLIIQQIAVYIFTGQYKELPIKEFLINLATSFFKK